MNLLMEGDEQKRQCLKCQNYFIGNKYLDHEKVCNQQQVGWQNQNYQNMNDNERMANQQNNLMYRQQIQNTNQFEQLFQNQQILRKCEYCNDDYPLEILDLHVQQCDARKEHQNLLQSVCPSQVFSSNTQSNCQDEDGQQKLEILRSYFELMEKHGEIIVKGEELVKISNFSIEPFAKTFEKTKCQSCNINFNLDEEILIMKCCYQIYHHICFSQIINLTNNCECGKKIID
ncbi:unnamed protein product [Paramecium octaurelia]|uniref:Uncharacterized protein n=1 Tax=Paramecium octaurelia TaxID=43137 RepID=A0A8S1WUV1_PAROT|nr:unnamed protein product [Paramecium octaurelia]